MKTTDVELRNESDVEPMKEPANTIVNAIITKKTVRSKIVAGRKKRSTPFKYATLGILLGPLQKHPLMEELSIPLMHPVKTVKVESLHH